MSVKTQETTLWLQYIIWESMTFQVEHVVRQLVIYSRHPGEWSRMETRIWKAALLSCNEVKGVYTLTQRDVQNEVTRVPTATHDEHHSSNPETNISATGQRRKGSQRIKKHWVFWARKQFYCKSVMLHSIIKAYKACKPSCKFCTFLKSCLITAREEEEILQISWTNKSSNWHFFFHSNHYIWKLYLEVYLLHLLSR